MQHYTILMKNPRTSALYFYFILSQIGLPYASQESNPTFYSAEFKLYRLTLRYVNNKLYLID